jgi:uncharacterized protein
MNRLLELEKELARFSGRGAKPNTPAAVPPVEPSVSAAQSYGNSGYSQQYTKPKGTDMIRILSIDGGGIRGVIPAMILEHIEKMIARKIEENAKNSKTSEPNNGFTQGEIDPRIQDYFDVFAGTSTGGIISAGLLCPDRTKKIPTDYHYRPSDFLKLYKAEGRTIFDQGVFEQRMRELQNNWNNGAFMTMYDRSGLDKVLDDKLGRFSNGNVIHFHDLLKPVIIVSLEYGSGKPAIFKNWENTSYSAANVLRATSAAPTYFDPIGFAQEGITITNRDIGEFLRFSPEVFEKVRRANYNYYIDGGVFRNNPANIALDEVVANTSLFVKKAGRPSVQRNPVRLSNNDVDRSSLLMLSLGTGHNPQAFDIQGAKSITAKIAITAFEQSMVGSSMMEEDSARNKISSSNYFRFNPPISAESAQMDNASPENIKDLESQTRKYLETPEVKQQLNRLVTKLIGS